MEGIKGTIKMKYNGLEWNQYTTQPMNMNHDIFNNLEDVKNYCGNGENLQETACWLDAYNWSLMKQTTLTEDIYQFITHRAHLISKGIENDIANFHIDWEVLLEALNFIGLCIIQII